MATNVTIVGRSRPPVLPAAEVRRIVRETLASAARADAPPVTVVFTDDAEIRGLNRSFRHKDRPTDVLSFPAGGGAPPGEESLGDLVISVETAARQARARRRDVAHEVKVLLIHGTLHLLGFDHEADSGEMEALEKVVRRRLVPSDGGGSATPLARASRAGSSGTSRRNRTRTTDRESESPRAEFGSGSPGPEAKSSRRRSAS